jgi:hypothetical protein
LIEKEKGSFTTATICEPMLFGPRLGVFKSLNDVNTFNFSVCSLIRSGKNGQVPQNTWDNRS